MKVYSYYDGIPKWIEDMSQEELEKFIAEEQKRCDEMNAKRKKQKIK